MLNITLIIIIFLMLTYIVTTEENIRRYRKIMEQRLIIENESDDGLG